MTVTRLALVKAARELIGTPWKHQGRHRDHGIDCVGLPILVGETVGLWNKTDIIANYPRRPDGTFVNNFRTYLDIAPIGDHKDGDVLIFSQGGQACHCGIRSTFRNQPGLIHAYAGYRKVVEQTLESSIAALGKPMFAFSFRNVEN